MNDSWALEPSGSPALCEAQERLHTNRHRLRRCASAFEQGRTFGLTHVTPSNILPRLAQAGFPPRLLIECMAGSRNAVAARLCGARYEVSEALDVMTGTADEVLPRCRTASAPSCARQLVAIGPCTSRAFVAAIQALQDACGITPLPGWVIRGRELPVMTLALVGTDDQPLAAGSAQMIGPGGRAMGFAICVAPSLQRRGFGSWLNSRLLLAAHERFGWTDVDEIVDERDGGSTHMNSRCGLKFDPRRIYLFAEGADASRPLAGV